MTTMPDVHGHTAFQAADLTVCRGLPPPPREPAEPPPLVAPAVPVPVVVPAGRPLTERWWPWFLAATILHGLALAAVVSWSGPVDHGHDEPLLVIGSIDLAGWGGGGGGSGGDGQESGAASAAAEAAPPEQATQTPAPEPPAVPQEPTPPTPIPSPLAETPRVEPTPAKPAPPPKPRPAPRKIETPPRAAPARPGTEVASGPVQAASGPDVGTGTGVSGDGPGLGVGQGAGPAGAGQGTGGGNGLFEGQFGQGDGPKFRHRSLPRYPDGAKREGKEGRVSLRLRIDASGVLCNVEVLNHCGLEFVEEALRAVRASTFLPARRNGQPVPCSAVLNIHFKLG
jgi:protein TonB